MTPPDVVTQVILFSVVYGLYEISILLVTRIEKAREARLRAEGLWVDDEDEDDGRARGPGYGKAVSEAALIRIAAGAGTAGARARPRPGFRRGQRLCLADRA